LLQNSLPEKKKKEKALEKTDVLRKEQKGKIQVTHSSTTAKHLQPDLTRLLLLLLLGSPADHALLAASVTDLVGADPFPLDRPGAEALVVGVVAGEVAVLDQAAA
jgi:hypothetical protein